MTPEIIAPDAYVEAAVRTESPVTPELQARFTPRIIRLHHAFSGIVTEGGELTDQLKRHIYYGAPLDEVNIVEELGDLMWYVALACYVLGVSLMVVMFRNIAKLRKRYPERFTEQAAIERNLFAEREVLEGRK